MILRFYERSRVDYFAGHRIKGALASVSCVLSFQTPLPQSRKQKLKEQRAECLFTQGRFPRDSAQHLQLPSETSPFHQHVLPDGGCAGGRRALTLQSVLEHHCCRQGTHRASTAEASIRPLLPQDKATGFNRKFSLTEGKSFVIRLVCHTQANAPLC